MSTIDPQSHSVAHQDGMNNVGTSMFANGLVPWHPATPPDLAAPYPDCNKRTTGRLRSCGYCGSMHPTDLAAALKAGARVHWADRKYGWPHKLYVEGIANPHAGMLESRMGSSHAIPLCPKTQQPCTDNDPESYGQVKTQSWHRPHCECMKAGTPTHATTENGHPMVRYQSGFNSRTGAPEYGWRHTGAPAKSTTDGKFYTVHLKDATPEECEVIERAMGLRFQFDPEGKPGTVAWRAFVEPAVA